jgi:hypothetical protein
MRVAITEEEMTVEEAPVGLLLLESGEMIVKTEYVQGTACECYIVSSGERFHGEGNAARVRAAALIGG